jgi:hypothetical protein|tara:strand:+ start:2335 stop:2739 length:405 start_codon:yes stop_codon:yes gene_type:complete
MKSINYKISAPTVLDFLKNLLLEVLGINHMGKQSLKKDEKERIKKLKSNTVEGTKLLIYRMAMYLAKMAMHDYEMSSLRPSHVAVGAFYVSLKLCEQLKQSSLICSALLHRLVTVSRTTESEVIDVSHKMLTLA